VSTAQPAAATLAAAPRARRGDEALPILVGATVALLPILVPAGPGNTAIADVTMLVSIVLAVLWASRERIPVTFPYAVGVGLMVIGGALAATVNGAPLGTALVLAQDLFLVLWAAALTLGRHDPKIIAAVTVTWCRVAIAYSSVGVVAYIIGFTPLSGVTGADGVRATYTFADPNLAGNYLVVSLFMMIACKRPRAPFARFLGYTVVLVAMGFTGSNGAMLTLLIGLALCVATSRYRTAGALAGALSLSVAFALTGFLMVFVLPHVDFDAIRAQASSGVPLLRDSFGRSGSSTSERKTILDEGAHLFLQGDAIGLGPGRTKDTFLVTQAPYVKEAHNDYLAALLERGALGAVGLITLGVAVAARCWRLLNGRLSPALTELVPRFWLLVVLAPVMAVAAGFYEVLHFRHLWTFLGLVAALVAAMHDHQEEQ
jgi:O-antigen ligase